MAHYRFPLAAALAAIMLAMPAVAGSGNTATASITVLQRVSAQIVSNLSAGGAKTIAKGNGKGADTGGTVTVPATYPLNAKPEPAYSNAMATQGANAAAPYSARIDITGSPNTTFSIVVQGWTQVSGASGASVQANSTTFYSASNTPNTVARGVFNSQGKASIYVGATIAIPTDPSGSVYSFKPLFVASYN